MRSLYVAEQGARLQKSGQRIEVWLEDARMESVRADELAQCVVIGNVGLTTQAVRALLAAGTDVVFLTSGGTFIGRLSCGLSKNVFLRRSQYRRLDDPGQALALARTVVEGKIENQRRLLLRYQRRQPRKRVATACARLRHIVRRAGEAGDGDTLRGIEGAAAREYFAAFGALITAAGIAFEKRLRRPPPDPVNVLLSFGYSLLGNLVQAAVETAGLDPYFGALHEPRYGRPSLVLDLMEEFRPVVVDSAVLRAINTRAVTARDFEPATREEDDIERLWERQEFERAENRGEEATPPERPIRFKRPGVRRWLAVWERRLEQRVHYPPRNLRLSLREVVRAQVLRLAAMLRDEGDYLPYLMPW